MEYKEADGMIFVRIDPGEKLVASLETMATALNIRNAVIASAIGMTSEMKLAFYHATEDRYDEELLTGELEIDGMQGNIIQKDGAPLVHLHAVVNRVGEPTVGGHVVEATCWVTMEIFLQRADRLPLSRGTLDFAPGDRVVVGD